MPRNHFCAKLILVSSLKKPKKPREKEIIMATVIPIVKSAIFVDFDNIYLCLRDEDEKTADEFATNPMRWLKSLEKYLSVNKEGHLSPEIKRKTLYRRCYINPRPFGKFRPNFIRAAFEVVDCPPLTKGGKTSADMIMIIDILDILKEETRFDEFIIFSGDSDFTHVLMRLRRNNRQTVMLAVGNASPAYRAAADIVIDQDRFVAEILADKSQEDLNNEDEIEIDELQIIMPAEGAAASGKTLSKENMTEFINQTVAKSAESISLAKLAMLIIKEFGQEIVNSSWLGFDKFGILLKNLKLDYQIINWGPGYIYDPKRHELVGVKSLAEFKSSPSEITRIARRITKATDIPFMTTEQYAAVFKGIAEVVNKHGYRFDLTCRQVRDNCLEKKAPINLKIAQFIVSQIRCAGYYFFKQKAVKPKDLAQAFIQSALVLCRSVQLNLDSSEEKLVSEWLSGGLANG